ncbi:MAG: hypothetical protein ACI9SV_000380, partial [Aquiluna sp.]
MVKRLIFVLFRLNRPQPGTNTQHGESYSGKGN